MTGSKRPRARSRAAAADPATRVDPPSSAAGAPPAQVDPSDRTVALRLARLHLRMGSLALARAELESLAGRAMLDEDALLDLAEVRWRTGDLAGAGEAASAVLGRGREDVLALVIAAESISAHGRPGEARRLADRAIAAADGPLEPLFAGIPRSLIWQGEDMTQPEAPGGGPATHGTADASTAAPTGAAEAFAGGRAALGAGDTSGAAVRLGVALRLEPAYAQDVLEAIGEGTDTDPALALVAGDALRLLGRESEARLAYDLARGYSPSSGEDAADAIDEPGDRDESDDRDDGGEDDRPG